MRKPKIKLYSILFIIFLIAFMSAFSQYDAKIISGICAFMVIAFIILCIVLSVRYNRYIENAEIKKNKLVDLELKQKLKQDDFNNNK